ncbi:MAG TPA: response regulator [Candidatus Nitrosocosmicus sp.]|nr:response regulator [Candidatus Nitrosocosmicus sp.]
MISNLNDRTIKNNIAIVDDERDLLFVYQKALESNGYNINTFNDSYEALTELKQHHEKYFLIISDIRMPKIDGFQLVNEVKLADPTLKIILMSAYNISESDIIDNLNPGISIDRFITKPISLRELKDIIKMIAKNEKNRN